MLEAVLRGITSRIDRDFLATNASALLHATRHGIAAPRLTGADLEGVIAGTPVTLETIAGDTRWPAPTTPERLRAAGAAIAKVHAIAMTPQPHLPYRPRPIAVDDFARDRRLARIPTTSLLSTADERLQKLGRPRHPAVFLHGDVWPGNIAWTADGNAVLIDWKTAGVGHPGVDLGELRKQVAMHFGSDAPAHVLHGWQHQNGDPADHVAYWDAVAALNTPTHLTDWPAYDENGTPLGSDAATNRRDRFLEAALAQL
jgi:aminoglycoside phosphotransferase (APT) family kinase protein